MRGGHDGVALTERLRLQLQARFAGSDVEVDPARDALHVRGEGVDVTVPLGALRASVDREPRRTSALIADFVRGVERRASPAGHAEPVAASRVLWCVRSRGYLDDIGRRAELLTRAVGADVVAFVAESLPGNIMRGVPRPDWEAGGLDDTSLARAADENTERRFHRLLERIRAIERLPADGWRLSGDPLYQGSILMVRALLEAFTQRTGGDVLIGVPDRGVALVVPAGAPGAERFAQRVTQEYREAMNPCSTAVLRSDGSSGAVATTPSRRGPVPLMPWLVD